MPVSKRKKFRELSKSKTNDLSKGYKGEAEVRAVAEKNKTPSEDLLLSGQRYSKSKKKISN